MTLQIYNTLSHSKEPFVPIKGGEVGIYVCGPTVYDMSHIGHARAYVAFDCVTRYLRRRFKVTYVRNFTDVDDRIIQRAAEVGEPASSVSERFIAEYSKDMEALGVLPADVEPKVTEHIAEIIALVQRLVERGLGYQVDGDVYYAVDKFSSYGRLSRRSLDDMEAGARVEVNEKKHNPMDFALWKSAKEGEPEWESPWGKGRPGWHIECSAMSKKYLGSTFDIHGGGKDLIFPHHENEIAQSEAASGQKFVNYWMHNGFVNLDNEKMSKSLGNFFTIRDVLEKFDAQALRYFLLTTHYRSPISFSDAMLKEAESRVRYLYDTLKRMDDAVGDGTAVAPHLAGWSGDLVSRFEAAMDDDFNTPKALGEMSEAFRLANDILSKPLDDVGERTLRAMRAMLRDVGATLGLFLEPPATVLGRMEQRQRAARGIDEAEVERLVAERTAARGAKDFARADALRDELAAMGVVIKDSASGTSWELR